MYEWPFWMWQTHSRLSSCPVCRISLSLKATTISQETWLAFQAELRHVEDFEVTICLKLLLELLQCNICHLKPTKQPIRQCRNGHLICLECFGACCVICKSYYYAPKYRNLIAELILSLLPKPCRFTSYGCKVVITDLNDHEQEDCIFRKVDCVFIGCFEKVQIIKLTNHLEEDHEKHHTLVKPLNSNLGKEQNKMKENWTCPKTSMALLPMKLTEFCSWN